MSHSRRLSFLLALTAVLALSPASRAAEGLYLTWNDCALAAKAAQDVTFACGLGSVRFLYCAFGVASPVDSVLGVEVVVDVQHSAATLPDWWRFDPAGCRAGLLTAEFDFTGQSACADFLFGQATGNLLGYYPTLPRGAANQAHIVAAGAVLPSAGYRQLGPDSVYYAARLVIDDRNTLSCAGCGGAACLVLNSITIRRQPGAPGGDVVVSVPGPDNANFATWQGGAGANCQAVPVRAVTWGQIKCLYR